MVDVQEALQHRLGPLEAWQWGALAGGAILVYRVVSGHQVGNTPSSVTLTPNNQPSIGGSGTSTVGSILSSFGALGLMPDEFSITLPDGTVVTFKGGRVISTTPPGGGDGGGGGGGGGSPPLGSVVSPLPIRRPGSEISFPPGAVSPLPVARPGQGIPGVNPNPAPGRQPASVSIPTIPWRPGGNPIPGANPSPLPGGRGGGVIPGTSPVVLPGRGVGANTPVVIAPQLPYRPPMGTPAQGTPVPLPNR